MKKNNRNKKVILILFLSAAVYFAFSGGQAAAQPLLPFPNLNIDVGTAGDAEEMVASLRLFLLLTVLSLVPAFLVLMTSFTRIVIVLGFVRNALGTQQTPPNQIVVGLALFLTIFIMSPIYTQINQEALEPYLAEEIEQEEALDLAAVPIRSFMFNQTREKDLALFVNIANLEQPNTRNDIPLTVLIPAFVISELKTAFQMGFLLFIPFLIIDMVVASTLMAMGMFMLPPVMISLPFKLLLFIMVDGWHLVVKSLVESFA
ncbi:flagellar type III secretion system pore protein FliP [Candidatus Contubernalis alkaliaceticus]|uniref:flagellar type III secretion system pore protein FliP n=1 Tax=Candidatus Contubernalis alkaliaceticus TaxID=338645 RepID=UPI001F4C470F|nr:flagellar type III secretion system pore protein FliP [Candidatus Contubernalis alkalaceticus]UNC91757.1 flagellar type III secretion system pore protein FliP [Candidatus Contubernalis alkalaceticus]